MITPQVSVIIPTCNRAQLLPVAIRSVVTQTFSNFELIIVDDASDDSIESVVVALKDDRIRWFRHDQRRGGAAARNTGIREARCELLAFLDDDDEWHPEKLERQLNLLLASPLEVGCVYTGYITIDRATGRQVSQVVPSTKGDLSRELLTGNCIGGTSSVLMRRGCLDKVGMFDERLPSFQDYDLWIRISRIFHFEYIVDPLLKYHIHGTKIWTNLDALREGLIIMHEKHGSSRAFRKYLSYQHLSLGVSYCYGRNIKRALESYLKAIRLYPFEIRHYFNLAICLLGSGTFVRIKEKKPKLISFRRMNPRIGAGGAPLPRRKSA